MVATFTKDCCGHEVMAWGTWEVQGLADKPVREMLTKAVQRCLSMLTPRRQARAYVSE